MNSEYGYAGHKFDPGEAPGIVTTMEKQMAILSEEIESLASRLAPVLRLDEPRENADIAVAAPRLSPIEEVSSDIDQKIARVRRIRERLVI